MLTMNRLTCPALSLALLLGSTQVAAVDALATVNGRPIPRAQLEVLIKELTRQGRGAPLDVAGKAREELIGREVLAQEAERKFGPSPALKAQIEFMRQQALINALREDFFVSTKPSEAQLREVYEERVRKAGARELRVRHILVGQEGQAQALITQIQQGAAFDTLAQAQSKDQASAASGGLLGWTPEGAFAPEFGAALNGLPPGRLAAKPVKTTAGWHVIRLDEVRPAQPPKFEEVRPQLVDTVIQQQWRAHVQDLRARAQVR